MAGLENTGHDHQTTKRNFERILSGDLEDLPEPDRNAVQVFLSSTFTDYSVERNMLMKEAVPVLRQHCFENGLDFQISDMRWGIRDEAQNDHATTELCLTEIKRCQRISRGPYFVCFLGNKYGFRPYPKNIESTEFEIIYNCAKELGKDTKLLDAWYYIDTNAVPQLHVLQPISSKFAYYNDETEENAEKRQEEVDEWNAIDRLLVNIFRESAAKAWRDGLISEETKHKYFRSVTESEVDLGLVSAGKVNERVLCFSRTFNNINHLDKKAKRFEDLEGQEVDEEAKDLLNILKIKNVPAVLPSKNIYHSNIDWTPEGVNENNADHARYLEEMKNLFITEIKRLVDFNAGLKRIQLFAKSPKLFREVLHQSLVVSRKCKVFCGRQELVEEIKAKLAQEFGEEPARDDDQAEILSDVETEKAAKSSQITKETEATREFMSRVGVVYTKENPPISMQELKRKVLKIPKLERYTKPLILTGESGSGKTALMAYVASQIDLWVAPLKPVKIIRFLGTSSQSSYISSTLMSIIRQIWVNYNVTPVLEDELAMDFFFLVSYLQSLLADIDTKTRPLFIILDSVDQLHTYDHAHNMNWMPLHLPAGVHLIVSTLPERHGCLKSAKSLITDESRFIEVSTLDAGTGEEILMKWMAMLKRTLTKEQKHLVMERFNEFPKPLYLMLVCREASLWKSYQPMKECILGDSFMSAIDVLFDRIEAKHGKILIEKSLAYLTAAKQGLTNQELEDVLSLDDEVLQDTYQYHLPPDPENIRLPPSLWRRIQIDLKDYLVTRQANGKDTMAWYHRQFKEAAQRRYLTGDCSVGIHSSLADYFLGKWSDKVKPLELFKKKKGSYPNALRNVPAQPVKYSQTEYNLRMLEELPFHLVLSGQFDEYRKVIRSFGWLHAKCKSSKITTVIWELDMAMKGMTAINGGEGHQEIVEEVQLLRSCLVLISDAVLKNPDNLGVQLIGQFPPGTPDIPESIRTLQMQAVEWVRTSSFPLLVPKTQCLPRCGTELLSSVDLSLRVASEPDHHETKIVISKENMAIYAVDHADNNGDVLKIYNMSDHLELTQKQHMPDMDFKSIQLVGNDRFLLCEVYVRRDTYTPVFKKVLLTHNLTEVPHLPHKAHVVGVSQDGNLAFLEGEDTNGKYSAIFEINFTREKCRLQGDFREYLDAFFSEDSAYLVTCGLEYIAVWNVQSGENIHVLYDVKSFVPHYFDYKTFMYVLSGNRLLGRKHGYNEYGNILIWDLKTGDIITEMKGHSYQVDIISLSQSHKRAISGTKQSGSSSDRGPKYFRIWDLEEGKEIACSTITGIYSVLDFLGDREDLVIVCTRFCSESMIWLLQGDELLPVYEVHGHNEHVVFAQCSPRGDSFITASVDNSLKIWSMDRILQNIQSLLERCPTKEHIEELRIEKENSPTVAGNGKMDTTCFAVSCDGKSAVAGSADGWILFYDLTTNKITKHHRPDHQAVDCALATSNAKYFVSTGRGIYVWDAASGEMVHELVGPVVHGRIAKASCLAESSNTLVVGFGGMECYGDIYDLNTGTKVKSIPGMYGFGQVAITSDAKKIASTFFEMPVIYDIESGGSSMNMENMDVMMTGATCLDFSPGDLYLVGGAVDGSVRVLQVDGNKYKFRFQHHSTVSKAAFTQDSERLITSGFGSILIWCLSTGQLLHTLSRHKDFIMDLSFVCDGQFLVTSSKDKQILVWSIADRVTVTSFSAHCCVDNISVAPDLSSIIFCPENVAYLGILQPNPCLQDISRGNYINIPETIQKAQALALAFSGGKVSQTTSRACSLL